MREYLAIKTALLRLMVGTWGRGFEYNLETSGTSPEVVARCEGYATFDRARHAGVMAARSEIDKLAAALGGSVTWGNVEDL